MRVTGTAQREAWLARCGVPDDVAAGLAVNDDVLAALRAMAKPDVLLEHGAHHERRCDEVIAILARDGPATAWQSG